VPINLELLLTQLNKEESSAKLASIGDSSGGDEDVLLRSLFYKVYQWDRWLRVSAKVGEARTGLCLAATPTSNKEVKDLLDFESSHLGVIDRVARSGKYPRTINFAFGAG
jgi:hypothetical protein